MKFPLQCPVSSLRARSVVRITTFKCLVDANADLDIVKGPFNMLGRYDN